MRVLYLVRHGESQANLERRYLGWSESPLSQEGHRQARAVAARLQGEAVSGIWCSDLGRTRDTAEYIQEATGAPLYVEPRLRELYFGQFEGLTYEEIEARWPESLQAWLGDPEGVAPPGGETLAALRERVLAALPEAERPVLVTHGGVIRALLAHFTGEPFWSWQVPPGSLTTLRLTNGTARVESTFTYAT